MSAANLAPAMHMSADSVRSTDTSWGAFLANKKRDAAFRREVSSLHKKFCDCPDYRRHLQWPTPTEEDEGSTDPPTPPEDGDHTVSDITIIDAGADIADLGATCTDFAR